MAGDTVTMDLVKDLQKRLEELETQIKSPPDNSVAGNRRSKSRYVGQGDANLPFSDLEGGQRSRKMTGSGSTQYIFGSLNFKTPGFDTITKSVSCRIPGPSTTFKLESDPNKSVKFSPGKTTLPTLSTMLDKFLIQ